MSSLRPRAVANNLICQFWAAWAILHFLLAQFFPRLRKSAPPPMPLDQLEKKNVMIIGANGSLGKELAVRFAVSGAKLHIVCSKGNGAATEGHIRKQLKLRGLPHEDFEDKQVKFHQDSKISFSVAEHRINQYETDLFSRTEMRDFVARWQNRSTQEIDILIFCTGMPMYNDIATPYCANGASKMYMANFLGPFILLWLLEGHLQQNARVLFANSFLHCRGTWRNVARKTAPPRQGYSTLMTLIATILYCFGLDFAGIGPRTDLSYQGYNKLVAPPRRTLHRLYNFIFRDLLFWLSLGFFGLRAPSDIQLYANMKSMQVLSIKLFSLVWDPLRGSDDTTTKVYSDAKGSEDERNSFYDDMDPLDASKRKDLQVHAFNPGLPKSNCLLNKVKLQRFAFQPTWWLLRQWTRRFGEEDLSKAIATAYWLATTNDPKVLKNSGSYWDGMTHFRTPARNFHYPELSRVVKVWEQDAGVNWSIHWSRRMGEFS